MANIMPDVTNCTQIYSFALHTNFTYRRCIHQTPPTVLYSSAMHWVNIRGTGGTLHVNISSLAKYKRMPYDTMWT